MKKGEQTREMILARAAQIFSRQGYSSSSLSDIMYETGLEKGGIYHHFSSKDQLMFEAFDYSVEFLRYVAYFYRYYQLYMQVPFAFLTRGVIALKTNVLIPSTAPFKILLANWFSTLITL